MFRKNMKHDYKVFKLFASHKTIINNNNKNE